MGERAEFVLRQFDAMRSGDVERVISQMSEDFEFVNPDYAIEPGTRCGPEGARIAFENLLEAFDDLDWEIERLEEEGELVVVTGTWSGRGQASGAEFRDQPFGVVVTFRADEIVRYEWFNRADEALETLTSRASRGAGP
jgi:ketosteroid isomerase-like protein